MYKGTEMDFQLHGPVKSLSRACFRKQDIFVRLHLLGMHSSASKWDVCMPIVVSGKGMVRLHYTLALSNEPCELSLMQVEMFSVPFNDNGRNLYKFLFQMLVYLAPVSSEYLSSKLLSRGNRPTTGIVYLPNHAMTSLRTPTSSAP